MAQDRLVSFGFRAGMLSADGYTPHDRRWSGLHIGVLTEGTSGVALALALATVADYVTLFCGDADLTAPIYARLIALDVRIETRRVVGIRGAMPVPEGILLEDGEVAIVDRLLRDETGASCLR